MAIAVFPARVWNQASTSESASGAEARGWRGIASRPSSLRWGIGGGGWEGAGISGSSGRAADRGRRALGIFPHYSLPVGGPSYRGGDRELKVGRRTVPRVGHPGG